MTGPRRDETPDRDAQPVQREAERERQKAHREAEREARRAQRLAEGDARLAQREAHVREREAHLQGREALLGERGARHAARGERDAAWALTRDRIVQAAVEIARREGADAVSMRTVAKALRVGAMSLYWHVPSKDDLVRGMQELVFDEMGIGGAPTGDWRADLSRIAYATRASLKRNGWMSAYAHQRPRMSRALMRHAELSVAAVDGRGLTLAEMVAIVTAVDDYVIGFVSRREGEPGASFERASLDDGHDVWDDPDVRAAVASGDFPTFARHAGQPWQTSADDRFAFGLTCLLDGVERFLERRAAEAGGAPESGPDEPTRSGGAPPSRSL